MENESFPLYVAILSSVYIKIYVIMYCMWIFPYVSDWI